MLSRFVRISIRLLPVVILALLIWQGPPYIENRVNESLDGDEIRSFLSQAVEHRTGLHLKVRGVRFDLRHGLIFSGIRLEKADPVLHHPYIFKTESLILRISYWNLVRGVFPFSRLVLQRGKLDPWSLSLKDWAGIFRSFGKPNANPEHDDVLELTMKGRKYRFTGGFTRHTALESRGLEIIAFPEGEGSGSLISPTLSMDMQVTPGEDSFHLEAKSSLLASGKAEGELKARGEWTGDETRRLFFQYNNINVPFLYQLLRELGFVAPSFLIPFPEMQSGKVSGKGSIHIYDIGLGLDATGKYSQVSIAYPIDGDPFLGVTGRSGEFSFNSGFDERYQEPAFVTLETSEPGIRFSYMDRNAMVHPDENRIEMSAEIDMEKLLKKEPDSDGTGPGLIAPHIPVSGKIKLFFRSPNRTIPAVPEIKLEAQDLVPFAGNQTNGIAFPEPLSIEKALYSISGNGEMVLEGTGKLYGAPWSLDGTGTAALDRISDGRLILKRKSMMNVHVKDASYRMLGLGAVRAFKHVIREGSKKNALITEDLGPVWKNKFRDTDFFAYLVRPEEFDLNIQFENMLEGAQGLAPSPAIFVRKRNEAMTAILQNATSSSGGFSVQYTSSYENSLPRHDLRIKGEVRQNQTPFPSLLFTDTPPGGLRFEYVYSGEGVLFGDIVNRSYTSFALDVTDVDISNMPETKAAMHRFQVDGSVFKDMNLRYRSSTDGPAVRIGFLDLNGEFVDIRGRGQYTPSDGGEANFVYYLRKPIPGVLSGGRFNFEILKNRNWIPEPER